jgi:hypothetical protein
MKPVMIALLLVGTVDRIEGRWAVVEWLPSEDLRDVALSACPPGIAEGDRIRLVARAAPDGPAIPSRSTGALRLLTPAGPIGLPADAPLPTTARFEVQLIKQAPAAHSPGRIHPIMGTREHGSMDLRLFRVGTSSEPAKPAHDPDAPGIQAAGHRGAPRSEPPPDH